MHGGVGGVEPRGSPLSLSRSRSDAPGFILWRVGSVSIVRTVLVSDSDSVSIEEPSK